MKINLAKTSGPRWLGPLQVEIKGSKVVFTALDQHGQEKNYEWTADRKGLLLALQALGVDG